MTSVRMVSSMHTLFGIMTILVQLLNILTTKITMTIMLALKFSQHVGSCLFNVLGFPQCLNADQTVHVFD